MKRVIGFLIFFLLGPAAPLLAAPGGEIAITVTVAADITPPVTTAAPPGGTYTSPVDVTLSANEPATIHYTTDGSTPTVSSPVFASPIPIATDTTLKFFGVDTAGNPEVVKTEDYVISAGGTPGVTFDAVDTSSRSSGWFPRGSELQAYGAPVWAEYQVDFGTGGMWTVGVTATNRNSSSAPGLPAGYAFNLEVRVNGIFQGNLQVPGSTTTYQTGTLPLTAPTGIHTVRVTWTNDAWAAGLYDANIQIQTVAFTPEGPPPIDTTPPTTSASPPGGTYAGSVAVTLTANEPATIHYTTDGSTPTAGSPVYSGLIHITENTTLKFFGVDTVGNPEAVKTEVYTISQTITIPAANTSNRSSGWNVGGTEVYTYGVPQWLEYSVDFGAGGSRTFSVTAKNQNSSAAPGLPAGYKFNLAVQVDGVSKGNLQVPGSTTIFQTGTLAVTVPAGVHTIRFTWTNDAWSSGVYDANIRVKEVSFTLEGAPPVDPVATPTITPFGGTFTDAVDVVLASATVGASIRYTLDNSAPTSVSALYTGPIHLSQSATLKAKAFKAGLPDSEIASAIFTIQPLAVVATPTITPAGGSFVSSVAVSLSSTTSGAAIRYTTDGSTPNSGSTIYASPFTLTSSNTVKAYATQSGMTDSSVASADFTITQPPSQTITIPAANTSNRSSGWNVGGTEVYTYGVPQWLEYSVDFGAGGSRTFSVTAKNQNSSAAPGLPAGYKFNLAVQVDGVSKGNLQVPGSTTIFQTGTLAVTVPAGVHTIRFTWTNDAWSSGVYDANIRVKEVSFAP